MVFRSAAGAHEGESRFKAMAKQQQIRGMREMITESLPAVNKVRSYLLQLLRSRQIVERLQAEEFEEARSRAVGGFGGAFGRRLGHDQPESKELPDHGGGILAALAL